MIPRVHRRTVVACTARAALVPAGAFVVHQLRFMLAFGSGASIELARSGHSYMHSLVPWLVGLVGMGAGAFLWAAGRAVAGQRSLPRYTISLAALWLLSTACLVAVYVVQESFEGMFALGHASGLAGVFGYGGWWAVPAAACVGLVLAVVFHGARWALDEIARRTASLAQPRARRRRARPLRPHDVRLPALTPLAGGWSGRGPPAASLAHGC